MNVKEFKAYIKKRFGITCNYVFEERKEGIRCFPKKLMSFKGERGVVVYRNGITKGFVSVLGKLAKKNTIKLTSKELLHLVSQPLKVKLEDGEYIGVYKGVPTLPLIVNSGIMRSNYKIR